MATSPLFMNDFAYKRIHEIGRGFFNVTAPFVFFGALDIRTHMNFCRLSNGRFLVIDTVEVTPELKVEIDHLTDNGQLMEAVVATHPFHTLFFPAFHALYPNVPMYGTPRHLRNQPTIPWAGDVSKPEVLNKWNPEIEMSVTLGTNFENPGDNARLASVFVFHRASRTVHVDDTIMYIDRPSCLLRCCCVPANSMSFHLSFTGDGLLPTAEAPHDFKRWLETVVLNWDFDNLVCAHMGNKIGGAKAKLRHVLESSEADIVKLSNKHARK